MKIQHLAVVAFVAAFLSGCITLPPMNFAVPNVGISQKKIEADLKSTSVTLASPEERTGKIPDGTEVGIAKLWQSGLNDTLNRTAIFRDDAERKVNLSVKILKLDLPGAGISMTTETAARYEIIDRKTGEILFTQDIASSGTTPFDYSLAGPRRAVESVNRAVQNNIAQFLEVLKTVDLHKPMPPAGAGTSK
ncbi:MAG: UDP-N-acetylglucosamine acyltransferase [Betaproteobacteria bacterium]|nr:UDP-N-acetylglucosamine acyltransferase [Betaproteobacteria bacterium]